MSYAPYPAYKDSGIPWLGQVPEDWVVKRLSYSTRFKGGSTPSKNEDQFWIDGTIPWVSPKDMKRKEIHDTEDHLTELGALQSASGLIDPGHVMMVVRSGILRHSIPAAINRVPVTVNQDMRVFLPFRELKSEFIYWVIEGLQKTLVELWSKPGTTVESLETEYVNSSPFPVPSIEEQTAIADFLDKKTAEIDDLIAKKEELLRLLAEQRTALITHAVTKGLNPNAPMKPSGIDWLGDVPEGWDVVPFKWCCQVQSGQVDPKLDGYKRLPLIAPDHIESGTGRLLPYESAEEQGAISGKYQFEAGEILYSKIRPELSKVALAPEAGLCSADMYAIRAMEGLRPEFLFFQMLSRHFHRFAVLESMRVAMPKINREGLGIFPVMVPDKDIQGGILDHIQTELAKMDLAEKKITTARDYLKEYRSAVITNAVTGKIKVA